MSLVSALTRELGRNRRQSMPVGVALADVSSGASPNATGAQHGAASDAELGPGLASSAARRIAAGHVGDPLALDGYVDRAWRLAALSLGAGSVLAALAVMVHPAGWVPASLLALGAGFDWARGRLAARVLIQGGVLVIRRGPWGGARLRRADIERIGFGACGRSGRRAPGLFLHGDFESAGASHLVLLRLRGKRPRWLIVPEAGVGEARAAVLRLRQWWSAELAPGAHSGSKASQAVSTAPTARSKNSE